MRRKRVVFDTNVVLSALVYPRGRLAWLRSHWRQRGCDALISRQTVQELARILAYPKFHLSPEEIRSLLEDYLPCCETVEAEGVCPILCRDKKDQPFLDLAHCGKADVLVTGDQDLLALTGKTAFAIETPEAYRRRISGDE